MGIHAVIKGKISSTGSNLNQKLEDLMTSNLFQNLLYLPFLEGLFPVLTKAVDREKTLFYLSPNLKVESFHFWPQWDNCEPDFVVSFIQHETGKKINVLVEAKLYSSLSGENQLVREWKDLNNTFPGEQNYLVYLTSTPYFPSKEFNRSKELDDEIDLDCFFWLTYESIFESLNNNQEQYLIIENILQLLRHYYFVPFNKWSTYLEINKEYKSFIKNEIPFNNYYPIVSKYKAVWTTIK